MPDLDYVTLVGRFGIVVGDGIDVDDEPDVIWCDEGEIRLVPLNGEVKIAGGSPVPWTGGVAVVDGTIDSDGHLSWRGKQFVQLVDLTSDKVNPTIGSNKATHRVEFRNVKADSVPVSFTSATVRIAADTVDIATGTCDLTKLLPVQTGNPTPIYSGPRGTGVTDLVQPTPSTMALELTDGTTTDPITLPVGPGGSDAGVAGYLTDPASASAVAVAAKQLAGVTDPGATRNAVDARVLAASRPRDPREFGAVGNGTTNDTAALQATLDAAGAGGTVELPSLTFKITAALVIPTGCEIRGTGPKGSVILASGDQPAFRTIGGEAQAIKNLKVQNTFSGTRTTYDIDIINPFKPVLAHVEVALGQDSVGKGGIHIWKDAGSPNPDRCFMPMLTDVWVRNGVVAVEDVTDGKATGCYIWSTYTGAGGAVQLTRSSNWTWNDVDVVPPQGDGAGYLLAALNNVSIIGGLIDGSYDDIMTGNGIKSTDFVRGLSVVGVKFFNLGRSGAKMYDMRRSSFVGNIFVQNNKANGAYPDVDLASCTGNVFVGNTHGAPNVRTTKARCYVEDSACEDNSIRCPSVEVNSTISPNGHYYNTPLTTLRESTTLEAGVPAVNWVTAFPLTVRSTTYTVTKPDLFFNRTILATAAITITLPSAGSVHAGDRVTIKNASTGSLTIATTSSQLIDGAAAPDTIASRGTARYVTDGTGWHKL